MSQKLGGTLLCASISSQSAVGLFKSRKSEEEDEGVVEVVAVDASDTNCWTFKTALVPEAAKMKPNEPPIR